MDQLNFDKKVARANEHYNDQLLSQVKHEAQRAAHVSMLARKAAKALNAGLKKQNSMSKIEAELQAQKRQAQKAVERFASEQKDAEQKVEDAEAAKAKADAEASKAAAMLAAAEKQAAVSAKREDARQAPGLPHIPAAERIANMVQYLRTALSHHNSISKEDLKIMQSFFLQHGGQLLSKLAQIEPDATWSDKHVMSTEQWAMDHGRPDQLSQEWGGKKVKKETLLRDVVGNELTRHESRNTLKRPDTQQAVQGLFGMASKLPLKFAPDHSEKMVEEPELGESMDSDDEAPTKKAFSSMMGIN
jgi:hypothetical protein